MQPGETKNSIIVLNNAVLQTGAIAAFIKTDVPETLHTKSYPCIQIILHGLNTPINIVYETEEERDSEYSVILDAVTNFSF